MDKKSFRIHTNQNDQNLTVQLNQSFDYLEILSLKLSQDKIYQSFTSDYGVLIGRVIANDGIGIPNAKISIFIPLDSTDQSNSSISNIYPYTTVNDKTSEGVRYNLITPKNFSGTTFPSKQQILDDDVYIDIYNKYYKYTTVTNASGDYMIFGCPIGQQIIHMDIDLSDIGQYSYTADAMVANGISSTLFDEKDNSFSFKSSTSLETLPQVISRTISVNIIPLWGDTSQNQTIGISRFDFKISLTINPVSYLVFNTACDANDRTYGGYDGVTDGFLSSSNHIRVGNNDNRPGYLPRMIIDTNITIKAYEYDENGNELPYNPLSYRFLNKNFYINNGIIILILPCNLNKVITDEYGNLVPSNDPNKGIGTTGKWRVEIYTNNGERMINFLLQKNTDPYPFIVRSNRIYSIKMQFYDAFNLRDDSHRNIENSASERAVFNEYDWLNGFLYIGFGFFDTQGSSRPDWLVYNFNNNPYYNIETRIIDVTDYLDDIVNQPQDQGRAQNFITLTNGQIGTEVTTLQSYNSIYGDNHSSYEPSTATAFNNNYIFLKGLYNYIDCFNEIKKYLNV